MVTFKRKKQGRTAQKPLPQKDILWLKRLQKEIWTLMDPPCKPLPSIKFKRPLTENEIRRIFETIKTFTLPCRMVWAIGTLWFEIYNYWQPNSKGHQLLLTISPQHFDADNALQQALKKAQEIGNAIDKKAAGYFLPVIESSRNKKALQRNHLPGGFPIRARLDNKRPGKRFPLL